MEAEFIGRICWLDLIGSSGLIFFLVVFLFRIYTSGAGYVRGQECTTTDELLFEPLVFCSSCKKWKALCEVIFEHDENPIDAGDYIIETFYCRECGTNQKIKIHKESGVICL